MNIHIIRLVHNITNINTHKIPTCYNSIMEHTSINLSIKSTDVLLSQESMDILLSSLERVKRSKSRRLLNIVYSLIVGVLSSSLTKRLTKAHRMLGVVVALLSFLYSRQINHSIYEWEKTTLDHTGYIYVKLFFIKTLMDLKRYFTQFHRIA
jgi:hypothetical protein